MSTRTQWTRSSPGLSCPPCSSQQRGVLEANQKGQTGLEPMGNAPYDRGEKETLALCDARWYNG
jgi:hypothetical protein